MDHIMHSQASQTLRSVRTRLNGATILSVQGEVDLANAASLRTELTSAIQTGTRLIVVDLTDLRYIDSSGINVLLDTHRAFAKDGSAIVLVVGSSMIQRTFKIVGLEQLMPMYPTVETAVEGFHRGEGAVG